VAELSLSAAIKNIQADKIDGLYYLIGTEKFFHDRFIDAITAKIFPDKSGKDLNLSILYGTENTLSDVLSAAMVYPMLSAYKLVIVREFDKMKITDPDALIKYLEHPQKTTCLVLSAMQEGRARIFSDIKRFARIIPCKPVPEYKMADWLVNHFKSERIEIEQQAAHMLVDHIGSSLLNLQQEIQKIINYKNDRSVITVEDVIKITGLTKDANIFALQKALAKRDLSGSLKISKNLTESGHDLSNIISVLFTFFRRVLIAGSLRQRGMNPKQISAEMHLREFQSRELFVTLQNFNNLQIERIIGFMNALDIQIKSSSVNAESVLQLLCYKICRI